MSSFLYQGCLDSFAKGRINFSKDRFKVLLVDGYVPDLSHKYRSEISGEISGQGYTPGGFPVPVTVSGSTVTLTGFTAKDSTIKARAAVYYKDGGGPMLDLLVAHIDFSEEVVSKDGPFTLTDSTLRLET